MNVDTIVINDFHDLTTLERLLGTILNGNIIHSRIPVPSPFTPRELWKFIGAGDWNETYRLGDFVLRTAKCRSQMLEILKEVACTIYASQMDIGPKVYYINVQNIKMRNCGSGAQRLQRGSGELTMITESFDMDLQKKGMGMFDHKVLLAVHLCLIKAGTFLHCDLKRSNMLIKYVNGEPIVKMTDFDGDLCFILTEEYVEIIYILHSIMLLSEIKCANDTIFNASIFRALNEIVCAHINTFRISHRLWKLFSDRFKTYISQTKFPKSERYIPKLYNFYKHYIQSSVEIEQIEDLLAYSELIIHLQKWEHFDENGVVSNEQFAPNAYEPDTHCVIS